MQKPGSQRPIKDVDMSKLIRPQYRCYMCSYQSKDQYEFGKVKIPTPIEEQAPGINDAVAWFCPTCFKETLPEIQQHGYIIEQFPLESKKEVVNFDPPKPTKPTIRVQGRRGIFS
jgi:hypothetical protein